MTKTNINRNTRNHKFEYNLIELASEAKKEAIEAQKKKEELIKTNTKIGESALANIGQNKANHNTAIGFESLNRMKQGNYNTALGSQTMINSNGNNIIKSNTAIGGKSLQNVKGGFNTAVGYESGNNIIGGEGNIVIGNKSNSSDKKSSNEIVIGNDAKGVKDSAVIGNSSNISIEPGNNNTTLGTESNKFETTYASKISNGEVTIKLPNQKLKPGMLMLDEDGNLTSGDLKTEIAANSSKGDTIFIEVNAGNIKGINNNPKVFYKFAAYKYNEVTNKKGDLLKNWNGKLDVSKTYVFGRKDNVRVHPFYISNVGYKKKPNKVTITNIVGKGMNYNLGIKGDQRIKLQFNSNFNATDKLYYYCTAHKNMIGEFKLFSSNWNKLDITVVNGSEPKPIKNIIFNLVLDKDVPKGQTVKLSYQTLNEQGTAIEDTHFKSTSGTIIFKAGEDSKQVEVPVLANTVYEESKTVIIRFKDDNRVLTNTDKGLLYSTAEILDNGPNPANEKYIITRISEPEKINNAPNAVEGFPLIVQLELDRDALTDIVLYVNTTNGTAKAGTHYEALKNKKITIKKGEREKIFSVQTKSDKKYTGEDKKFKVKITGDNLEWKFEEKECIIKEGDNDPSKKIYNLISSSPTVMEGDSGKKDLKFNLDIQEKALKDIKINYETIDSGSNKARKNIDYEYKKGSITIKEGQRKATIVVKVKGDTTYDNNGKNHLVYVRFSGQNINDRTFSGAIIENDESAENYTYNKLKINGPEVTEGNTKMKFKLNLGEKARSKVIINYETLKDQSSATAGKDYVSKSGQLIFNEGKQESEFEITIKDDNVFEIEEKIVVEFSGNNIGTFSTFGIIKPDNDEDPNQAKPDLTTNGTSYNNNTGELSIKLTNTGNRDVIVNNNQQFNSLFEATTNSSNRKDGTPEIKIGNKTYYVSKNDITYLDIKNHNFSTYFEKTDGININSNKGNKHKITLGSLPSGHNFWTVVNNPGLKKDDSIEFKIKASFKAGKTYIFMADDIKYDSVKESNESNNYFVFTPNKTITYEEPSSEYPKISGYDFVEENKDVFVSKMNGNLISLYVQHYPPPDYPEKDIAIKNISPSELKNNWLLVTKENDNFKQYQIVDYDEWGSGDTTEIYSDGYYYNIGTNPIYTGKNTDTIYWYKKK